MRGLQTLLSCCLALVSGALSAADVDLDAGRKLYRDGVLADGSPIQAFRGNEVAASGSDASCARCHRRSGMGGREGEILIPPLTADKLFARPATVAVERARTRHPLLAPRSLTRPPYANESLERALRQGLDSAGQPLNSWMPHYRLAADDMANLAAYLRTLGVQAEPGVDSRHIRLATITTSNADPARSRVVIDTLEAWAQRGSISNLDITLETWHLSGSPVTWAEQLDQYHTRNPVFAVLSGISGSEWNPVARFCEAHELPCVFPILDAAPEQEGGHYNAYLDSGIPLEGRLLTAHLSRYSEKPPRVIQLYSTPQTHEVANRLAATLPELHHSVRPVTPDSSPEPLSDLRDTDIVIAWLPTRDVQRLAATLPLAPREVFLSARLANVDLSAIPPLLRNRVRWVSSRLDPVAMRAHQQVWLRPWLNQLGLSPQNETLQSELHVALYAFGDALARMHGTWRRDFLLENLETVMYTRPLCNTFYSLSLGPGQRVAAKSGRLLAPIPPDFARIEPVGPPLLDR